MEKKTKLLVTGSKGLIGRLLVKQLQLLGFVIVELDNRLPTNHVGHGDIRDLGLLKKLTAECHGIIHLAAVSRVVWGEQDPQLCWDVNVSGTRNVLEAAFQAKYQPWVIYASSREVYGQQSVLPVIEDIPLSPLNTYARSKVEGECLVNAYQKKGLITAILRFSSVYGCSYDHQDRVIPAFCNAAILNKPLRIDGFDNLFDFTHVKDTVAGVITVINLLLRKGQSLPPIHLTTGKGTSLLDVIYLIQQSLGAKLQYNEAPARTYDVHCFYGNTQRANQILDWQAKISLAQGISDLLQQFQHRLNKVNYENN